MVGGAGLLPAGPAAFVLCSWLPCEQSQQMREEVSGYQKHQEIVFPRRNWGSCPTRVRTRHSVSQFLWHSRGLQTPAINLVSFHFTLLEKKRKKLFEKKKKRTDFLLQLLLLLLSSIKDLVMKDFEGMISIEVCRKLNPTCSFQCRKQ